MMNEAGGEAGAAGAASSLASSLLLLTFVENFVKRDKRSLEPKVDFCTASVSHTVKQKPKKKRREESHLLFFTHKFFKYSKIKYTSIR